MYVIVWRYEVAPAHEAAFRAAYAADGAWAALFKQAHGFLGSTLYRDEAAPGHFITLDAWSDLAAFEVFQAACGAEYAALDAKLAPLSRQVRLGAFATG